MNPVIIYCILSIAILLYSMAVLRYRKSNYKDTIIKRSKQKYNNEINVLYGVAVIGLFVYFLLNLNWFISPDILQLIDFLLIINISQMLYWGSIIVFVISFKFIREEEFVDFEYPSKRESKEGEIEIGMVFHNDQEKHPYFLKLSDLAQHMFITGITGSGKSNFIQHFLINFKKKLNIPFLLAEFKGEYHHLQKVIDDLIIFKVGENFCINIFDPEGTDAEVHAERVFQIFRSGGLFEGIEYTPQMERVFVDILREVCKDPKKMSWSEFYNQSEAYLTNSQGKDYMFKQSVTAVQNRIRRYSLGTLKHVFEEKRGLDVKEIFKYNVLLDLSSIIKMGGEKEDTLFFLNMFFKYLWDKNIEHGSRDYKGIRHVTIIEDAQYFASQEASKKSKLTSYIEDVALLLRGTGECLISLATRPNVSFEILANCGVFVTFQNHMQKEFLTELLNFDGEQKKYLSMLKTGDAIIRVNSIGKPFALRIPYIERSWLNNEEIWKTNDRIIRDIKGIPQLKEEQPQKDTQQDKKINKKNILNKIRVRIGETFTRVKNYFQQIRKKELKAEVIEEIVEIKPAEKNRCWKCGENIDEGLEFCEGCKGYRELENFIENLYEENQTIEDSQEEKDSNFSSALSVYQDSKNR